MGLNISVSHFEKITDWVCGLNSVLLQLPFYSHRIVHIIHDIPSLMHLKTDNIVEMKRLAIYCLRQEVTQVFHKSITSCMNLCVLWKLYCIIHYYFVSLVTYVKATASLSARLHFSAEFSFSAAKNNGGLPWCVSLKMLLEEIPSCASRSLCKYMG